MELFYTDNIQESQAILSQEESYHCVKILRHKEHDIIHFTDGLGGFYQGRIEKPDPKKCQLLILKKDEVNPRGYYLHIAIAPTKNIDRIEFFIEKSVEIGIDEITFLKSERSERKEVKLERVQKIAVAAMKQSKKAFLPKINSVISFNEFVISKHQTPNKYIASLCSQEQHFLSDIPPKEEAYLILIGPEGDFSLKEVQTSIQNGFKPLSLGQNIYRTETAGIVASMYINFINTMKNW